MPLVTSLWNTQESRVLTPKGSITRYCRWDCATAQEAGHCRPPDRPVVFGKFNQTSPQPTRDPIHKLHLGSGNENRRTTNSGERRHRPATLQLSREPVCPLGNHGQSKALGKAVENEHRIVIRKNGAIALNSRTEASLRHRRRNGNQMPYRASASRQAEASSVRFSLLSQAQFRFRKIRSLDLEHLIFLNGCPRRANVRIPADDREQMKLSVTAVLCNFSNTTVNPQPDAHRGVLQRARELQPPKAFMRVLHLVPPRD